MIRVENITVKAADKFLLDDVTATFDPGMLHLVIGPNGAGKSTLVKVLTQQVKPASGKVFYEGEAVDTKDLVRLAKKRAVLSQNTELAFPLKVWDVVMLGRYPHFEVNPRNRDITACAEAMDYFNVSGFAEREYNSLSGGEKQRVHFARVLSQIWYSAEGETRYLFLDEPLTYLDIQYQFMFMKKLKELLIKPDLVIVGVIHDLNLASRFGDRIYLMNSGKIIAEGAPPAVLTRENISGCYGLDSILIEDDSTHSRYIHFR